MADPVATIEQICRELLLTKYVEHVDSSEGDASRSLFMVPLSAEDLSPGHRLDVHVLAASDESAITLGVDALAELYAVAREAKQFGQRPVRINLIAYAPDEAHLYEARQTEAEVRESA